MLITETNRVRSYKVLTLEDESQWLAALQELPAGQRDVLMFPGFFSAFEKHEGNTRCFIYRDGRNVAIYAFLLNEVNAWGYHLPDTYFDIQAAYGYNGALTTTTDSAFLSRFSESFKNYCHENNIISEMVRFNPVLRNESNMPHVSAVNVLDNVAIDLSRGYDAVWQNSYVKNVRTSIRKGESYGLTFEYFLTKDIPSEKLQWFKDLYWGAMKRNNAKEYYFFSDEFFNRLARQLGNNSVIAFILHEGEPITTEWVLLNETVSYSYLAGTLAEKYHLKANTYLCHRLLPVLIELGVKHYSMGGGLSRNDSLFTYKKSFSKDSICDPIFIGSAIHNKAIYDMVVDQWIERYPHLQEKYCNYVLKYRYFK